MATDFAAPGLDLTSLKARLANLGVDVVAPKASPQKAQYPSALALAASPGPVSLSMLTCSMHVVPNYADCKPTLMLTPFGALL